MTKVKICGLSEPITMQAVLDQGADMVGLVFFAKSPRNVSLEQAALLSDQARGKAKIIALVVDANDAFLRQLAETVRPDFLQAQGQETAKRIAEMKALTSIPIIKVIKVETALDVASAKTFPAAELMLYEAKAPKGLLPGGNGLRFDWTLLHGVEPPFMLAGGLRPDNVAEAVRMTRAPIVDVSSGVETSPGVKDVHLIAKFIKAAKSATTEDRP
jgi:phosphoribosylanthranilate isomerase